MGEERKLEGEEGRERGGESEGDRRRYEGEIEMELDGERGWEEEIYRE